MIFYRLFLWKFWKFSKISKSERQLDSNAYSQLSVENQPDLSRKLFAWQCFLQTLISALNREDMTSFWRDLWSTYKRWRAFLLPECAKLMVLMTLKIWRWSVCNFGRYRGEGAKIAPCQLEHLCSSASHLHKRKNSAYKDRISLSQSFRTLHITP